MSRYHYKASVLKVSLAVALLTISIAAFNQTISGPTTACVGAPTTYSFNAPGNVTFDGWEFSTPGHGVFTTSTSSPVVNVTWSSSGQLMAKYTDWSNGGMAGVMFWTAVYPAPVPYLVGGSGAYCNGSATVTLQSSDVGTDYNLLLNGDWVKNVVGTGSSLVFNVTTPGTYTIVAYNGPSCTTTMSGSAVITVSPIPRLFKINSIASFQGNSVSLSGSEIGVTYYLKVGSTYSNPVIGTGAPLFWKNISQTGTIYIVATLGGGPPTATCGQVMVGSATVGTPPCTTYTAFQVSGRSGCGTDTPFVQLSGSQANINYQLLSNGIQMGAPKVGTGGVLTWTQNIVAGTYKVRVTDLTNCPNMMTGQIVIVASGQIPTVFNVTTSSNCMASLGGTVSLGGFQSGVSYQLYKDGVATGSALTTSPISWVTTERNGVYTIVATNTISRCTMAMNGSPTISNPTLSINSTQYPCTYYFSPAIGEIGNCNMSAFSWNFGDGGTSTQVDPFHAYAANGTYTVTLQITATCGTSTCNLTVTKQVSVGPFTYSTYSVNVPTDKREKIVNTSASTFSDSWALPFEESALSSFNPFLNGTTGVWRNDGVYVYKENRSQSSQVDISVDGTFTMDYFNWQMAAIGAIPGWIKANSITRYSPFSYELENKDVLGIYSANLYDYGGHLTSASGSNMRNNEMAFTSFEYLIGKTTGNWTVGTDPTQSQVTYNVQSGYGHMAIVETPSSSFTGVTSVDVVAITHSSGPLQSTNRFIPNVGIVCTQVYSGNSNYTVIVLNDMPFTGVWTGSITVRTPQAPIVGSSIDGQVVHTGANSLKITNTTTFRQPLLTLDNGKTYQISAWASIGNPSLLTPQLGTNIGIDISIKNKGGTLLAQFPFQAAGPLIEGWQQVKGTFVCPAADAVVEISFRRGDATAVWFDDLRLHPNNGNMKGFVYDLRDYRLTAVLDEENFASLFYYDAEGNLFLTKKETERGRKTISENITHMKGN
ncbi:hypothetical protein BH09BAC3_BH09BAC3_35200 [soil metagenome]